LRGVIVDGLRVWLDVVRIDFVGEILCRGCFRSSLMGFFVFYLMDGFGFLLCLDLVGLWLLVCLD